MPFRDHARLQVHGTRFQDARASARNGGKVLQGFTRRHAGSGNRKVNSAKKLFIKRSLFQSLGLCTATVMFVLSQDRLNMDLDRDCLELMLNLLESDVSYQQALDIRGLSSTQLEKNKQKVRELCAEIQSQGHAMHLNLDNITVSL